MNEKDLNLMLLMGTPIPIDGGLSLHVPKLRDIITMGESRFNECLSGLLFDKSNIDGLNDDRLTNFEVLFAYCFHNAEFKNIIFNGLKLIFKEEAQMGDDGSNVFFYFDDSRKIDLSNFDVIQRVLKKANHIKVDKEPEFNPANSRAAQMIELIKKGKKNKPKPKETMNLHSIISGMAWKSNAVNIFNIFDLTIYQLYNGFYTTENIDNYHHTLSGVYAGTVDGKEIKFDQIHWAKIIDK